MSQTGAVVSFTGAFICGIEGVGVGVGVGVFVGVGVLLGSVSTVISIEDSAEGSTPGSESSFLHPVKGKQTEAVTKEAASNILTVLFIFLCIKTIRINTFSLQKSIPKPHIKNDYNKHNLNSYPDYGTN